VKKRALDNKSQILLNVRMKVLAAWGAFALLIPLLVCSWSRAEDPFENYRIDVSWEYKGKARALKTWYLEELLEWRGAISRERAPQDTGLSLWRGPRLSKLVQIALKGMPLQDQGIVDLIVLKGEGDREVSVPRAFVRKYPMILAVEKNGASLPQQTQPVYTIVPWNTEPELMKEIYPAGNYFIEKVKAVVLTNHQDRYSKFYLERRTDPMAIRGERVYSFNCMGCHNASQLSNAIHLVSQIGEGHLIERHRQKVNYMPQLSDSDQKGLVSYLKAYLSENPSMARK